MIMNYYKLSLGISLIAGILAIIHMFTPGIAIDGVTLVLIIIAFIPWLAPILKTLEVPGLKVEFKDWEDFIKRTEQSEFISVTPHPEEKFIFEKIANEDPNIALAGLRIEIEKRLQCIARKNGIDANKMSIRIILRSLPPNIITQEQSSILNDLIGLLNNAVHAKEIDPAAVNWAINIGPRILASLDQLC